MSDGRGLPKNTRLLRDSNRKAILDVRRERYKMRLPRRLRVELIFRTEARRSIFSLAGDVRQGGNRWSRCDAWMRVIFVVCLFACRAAPCDAKNEAARRKILRVMFSNNGAVVTIDVSLKEHPNVLRPTALSKRQAGRRVESPTSQRGERVQELK